MVESWPHAAGHVSQLAKECLLPPPIMAVQYRLELPKSYLSAGFWRIDLPPVTAGKLHRERLAIRSRFRLHRWRAASSRLQKWRDHRPSCARHCSSSPRSTTATNLSIERGPCRSSGRYGRVSLSSRMAANAARTARRIARLETESGQRPSTIRKFGQRRPGVMAGSVKTLSAMFVGKSSR